MTSEVMTQPAVATEIAQAMGATAVCLLLLCAFAAFAVLAFNASADGAYDAALAGTVGWEDVLHAGFALNGWTARGGATRGAPAPRRRRSVKRHVERNRSIGGLKLPMQP